MIILFDSQIQDNDPNGSESPGFKIPSKYFMTNPTGILDSAVATQVIKQTNLVVRQLEEEIFIILKDGKHMIQNLHKLTKEHGYSIVLYCNRREYQIIHALREFEEACKQDDHIAFPKICVMAVKDHKKYANIRANDLKTAEGRPDEILVAKVSVLNFRKKLRFWKEFQN